MGIQRSLHGFEGMHRWWSRCMEAMFWQVAFNGFAAGELHILPMP
jgi:hypothetical protein